MANTSDKNVVEFPKDVPKDRKAELIRNVKRSDNYEMTDAEAQAFLECTEFFERQAEFTLNVVPGKEGKPPTIQMDRKTRGRPDFIKQAQQHRSFGVYGPHGFSKLFQQLAGPFRDELDEGDASGLEAAAEFVAGMRPRDPLEGMLAVQMAAIHNHAMNCMRLAEWTRNSPEVRENYTNRCIKLANAFTRQMEALGKYRNKGKQSINVKHIHVHEGAQAIVGDVNTKEGGSQK